MNTCSTCQHWRIPVRHEHATPICSPEDIDTGVAMVMPFEVRKCCHPALTKVERPVEENGFGVVDGSGYYAALCTASGFGCVRHEAA